MTVDASFDLLPGERIHSMVPLKNERYLCAVESGSLQMIDIKKKTAYLYTHKYKGKRDQCIVPFPEFNEKLFPLVLIKEWEHVVIFNIKLKHYVKVTDIDTEDEWENCSN